jgi:hypothetical protein
MLVRSGHAALPEVPKNPIDKRNFRTHKNALERAQANS